MLLGRDMVSTVSNADVQSRDVGSIPTRSTNFAAVGDRRIDEGNGGLTDGRKRRGKSSCDTAQWWASVSLLCRTRVRA